DVFEDIALDQYAAGVLQLEQVLDGGPHSSPGRGLEEVITTDLDVRRHEVGDRRVAAAEHDILAGRLQIVVDDLEGPWATPAHDGLGVLRLVLEVGEVGIDDGERFAVECDAAHGGLTGISVDIAPVDDQVGGQHLVAGLAPVAEFDEGVDQRAGQGFDLDADEPKMVSLRGRLDGSTHA